MLSLTKISHTKSVGCHHIHYETFTNLTPENGICYLFQYCQIKLLMHHDVTSSLNIINNIFSSEHTCLAWAKGLHIISFFNTSVVNVILGGISTILKLWIQTFKFIYVITGRYIQTSFNFDIFICKKLFYIPF